jgi:hypothetical protein
MDTLVSAHRGSGSAVGRQIFWAACTGPVRESLGFKDIVKAPGEANKKPPRRGAQDKSHTFARRGASRHAVLAHAFLHLLDITMIRWVPE